jgi:hypothetical protein
MGIGSLIGSIHEPTGIWIQNLAVNVSCTVADAVNALHTAADRFISQFNAAALTNAARVTTNWIAGIFGVSIVANMVTGGLLAGTVVGVPYVGATLAAAIAGGPLTIALIGAAALVMAGWVFLFNFDSVKDAPIAEMDEDSRKAFYEAEQIKANSKKEAQKAFEETVAAATA